MNESFGEKLRNKREALGYTLERVEREANIPLAHLENLENERLTMFPSDVYLIGFLRNYGEFLELDPEELVSLYKRLKLQESPTPEELYYNPQKRILPFIIASILIVLTGVGVFFLIKFNSKTKENVEVVVSNEPQTATYTLTQKPLQKRIYKGDKILVPMANGEPLELTVSETFGKLTFDTPIGKQHVELGEEVSFDLDQVGSNDITVFLADISKTDPTRGAEVEIMLFTGAEVASTDIDIIPTLATDAKTGQKTSIIFDSNTPYPFTLSVAFRSSCLFRYASDKKDRIEDYFTSGDSLNITSNNAIRVWMSNANALSIQVIGGSNSQKLEVGRAGQVLVQDIKWVKGEDGKYKLVVLEVD